MGTASMVKSWTGLVLGGMIDRGLIGSTDDPGQMTIVFPDLGLVLVRRQNCDAGSESLALCWMGPDFLALVASTVKVQ